MEIRNLDLSLKMTWFHWSTDQFWWFLVNIECFHFHLNGSSVYIIGILLPCSSWLNLQSVLDWEIPTSESLKALIISLVTNQLKIRILLNWLSFLVIVLGFERLLDRFEQLHLGILWWLTEIIPPGQLNHCVWLDFHNAWKMDFCASDICLPRHLWYWVIICFTPKIFIQILWN